MSQDMDKGKDGAGLWARAREDWRQAAPPAEAPDALILAAYLDGTLGDAERERVEAWMAVSPEALDLMIAARAAQDEAPAAAPDGLLSRAQGLVRDRRPARKGLGAWVAELAAFRRPAWQPVAWAGVAAVMLVVSASGFELGRQGALNLVTIQTASTDDLGFGLSDSAEELL